MKPKNKVFDYFSEITESNGRKKYSCMFCNNVYVVKNVTRFAQHLIKNCDKCPIEVKSSFKKVESPKDTPTTATASSSESTEQLENSTFDEKAIHKAFARAVYVTGMPLSIFEHPLWNEAFYLLKPGYKPPSRKILSQTLLEEEYLEMKKVVTQKIMQASVLHLAVDGWTNIRNDSILNIMVYTPKPFFYTSIDAQANRHTGEFIAEKISEIMEDIGAERFLGIVSDNASNMKKCGRLLVAKYNNTTWIGCLAHTLNLLIADIMKMPEVHELFTLVVAVVSFSNM